MRAGTIPGYTNRLGAPVDWDPAKHGPCSVLHVRRTGQMLQSIWHPSEEERRAIAGGMPVVLTVWGKDHPPVSVDVQRPEDGDDG